MNILQEALSSDYKNSSIRLREGEYQFTLAKAIASFQLEMCLPNVKDIIRALYGEEKTNDTQFIRKIQTILKKMEKSNIVKILPKRKPWDLQRYALTSFKFQDIEKNRVIFATEDQIKQTQDKLRSIQILEEKIAKKSYKIWILVLIMSASYVTSIWALMQHVVNPIVFICAFSLSVACSVLLGKTLSHK
jgi:hypothetical protein